MLCTQTTIKTPTPFEDLNDIRHAPVVFAAACRGSATVSLGRNMDTVSTPARASDRLCFRPTINQLPADDLHFAKTDDVASAAHVRQQYRRASSPGCGHPGNHPAAGAAPHTWSHTAGGSSCPALSQPPAADSQVHTWAQCTTEQSSRTTNCLFKLSSSMQFIMGAGMMVKRKGTETQSQPGACRAGSIASSACAC